MHLAAVITYLKYKPAWLQLVIFGLITCGTTIILGSLTEWLVNAFYHLKSEDFLDPDFTNPAIISALRIKQGLLTISIFLCSSLLFAYKSDQRPLQYLGWKKPQPALFWIIGIALLLLAYPLASWINQTNEDLHLPASFQGLENKIRAMEAKMENAVKAMLQMRSFGEYLLMLLLVALVPAFCEEVFFRSVLQRLFIQMSKRPWMGIIITAIFFSLFHGSLLGFFTRVFLGILLGAMYWYSGSIWPSVIAHFLHNGIQVTLYYHNSDLAEKDPSLQPGIIILSVVAVVGSLWYMRRISHTHYGELYDTDDDLVLPSPKDQ